MHLERHTLGSKVEVYHGTIGLSSPANRRIVQSISQLNKEVS